MNTLLKLTAMGEEACMMLILRQLARVQKWVEAGDPRAQPYIDANAVMVTGHVEHVAFHKERFVTTWVEQGINEEDLV